MKITKFIYSSILDKTHNYKIFNLTVSSEIELPGLLISDNKPEIIIKFGKTPESLGSESHRGVMYEAIPGKFLLKVFDIARYYVTDGNAVIIEPLSAFKLENARVFLTSSVMGALLHQRASLPIHASVVETGGKSILFAGVSGAGKSTLAAFLATKGCAIVADDIAVIDFEDEHPIVFPGFPHLKLWKDAITKLHLPIDSLSRIRDDIDKYIDYTAVPSQKKYQVDKVFILGSQNCSKVTATKISGKEKFVLLKNHVYRKQFIPVLGQELNVFQSISKLAASVELYRLNRPSDGFFVEAMANEVFGLLNQQA